MPYRGLGPAVNDIIAGHVDLMFDTPTTSLPLHRDGKVKIIATGTPERVREVPGHPDHCGIRRARLSRRHLVRHGGAAATCRRALVERINRDVVEILAGRRSPSASAPSRWSRSTKTPAEAAKFFAEETELWGKVIKQANIQMQ